MGIDRGLDHGLPGFYLGDKAHEVAAVVGFREALALHDAALFQHRLGVEEAVGGDKVHPRVRVPPLQQDLQNARRGGLAHSHRSRQPDDEGHVPGVSTDEGFGRFGQLLPRPYLEVNQARQWQVDVLDFLQVEVLADPGERLQFRLREHLGHGGAACAPILAVEVEVRRRIGS